MAQQGQPQYNQAPPSQHPSQHQPGYPPPGPGAPVVMVGEGVCPKCGSKFVSLNWGLSSKWSNFCPHDGGKILCSEWVKFLSSEWVKFLSSEWVKFLSSEWVKFLSSEWGMLLTDNNAFICGLLWAFFCFPFGLICLSSMWKKRCVSCGFEVPQCC
ncbi:Brain protein I3 [Folsomia candida]|uniref:Brain protein I3 n=1 Tax=Folsomia candida TaxID=158441 RepID=A0A226DE36_FOLCA|nr:Brain protein I3 [Folsomia candida]